MRKRLQDGEKLPVDKPIDRKVREEIRRLRELADDLRRRAFEAFQKKKRSAAPPKPTERARAA
jgi:hypothetical protein